MNSILRPTRTTTWTGVLATFALGALIGFVADSLGLRDVINFRSFSLWLLAWAALGGVLGWLGHQTVVSIVAAASLVPLLVVGSTPLVAALASKWVRADPIRLPIDAVVVLSSGLKSDSLLNDVGTERLLSAIEILRSTAAHRLVTTRVRGRYSGAELTTDVGQRRLLAIAGVDSGWTVVDSVWSTRDEALRSARLLLPASPRIAVVTSPLHTRRACATFERVGFTVTCVPAREIAHVTANPVTTDDRLAAFDAYLYERLGMIKYEWKGWVHH